MRAWLFQDSRQKQRLGNKAPWSVGWLDPEGRRKSKRIGSKSMAEKYARKVEGELAAGLYEHESRKTWKDFRKEYEQTILPRWRSEESRVEARHVLNMFERVAKPTTVARVDDRLLAKYVAARLKMPGRKVGDTLSRATIRKELRTVRAALGEAKRWKYIARVPAMPEVDDYRRDKSFVTEEHFNAMLAACDAARLPADQHYTAGAFWQALLALAMVTGMRKSAMMALRWDDVDLEAGYALSRAADNKGKRDHRHNIGPIVGLLRELYRLRKPGAVCVFGWNHTVRTLNRQLLRIQAAAGIHLPCPEDHEHTETCHAYTFHSFRFGFAQHNYGRLSKDQLQEQMGHRSGATTDLYIDYAKRQDVARADVFVPSGLAIAEA